MTPRVGPAGRAVQVAIRRWADGAFAAADDFTAAEEPLGVLVNGEEFAVTMRTPGDDFALAAGLLAGEGVLQARDDVAFMGIVPSECGTVVDVRLSDTAHARLAGRPARALPISSSCGICGASGMDSVFRLPARLDALELSVSSSLLARLPDRLREEQAVFDSTGGLHAAGLFTPDGAVIDVREDIGRHNAVDKVLGAAFLERRPLAGAILVVSGRTSLEIVQKAGAARVPILCSVSAPSSLAVDTAIALNMTLAGFVRRGRFNVYAAGHRIAAC